MALSRTEQRAEAVRQEQSGSIILITGSLACVLSTVLSPRALESLQTLPDNLEPIEYLAYVLQAFQHNFSDLLAVRGPIFVIGLAQLCYSICLISEARKMQNNMIGNR